MTINFKNLHDDTHQFKQELIMIFRYDFGRKLDLTKFSQQCVHYTTYMDKISYHLFINSYKLVANINKSDNDRIVEFFIYGVDRDADGDVSNTNVILPLASPIFKEIFEISNLYNIYEDKGMFVCNNPEQVSDKICKIMKILFKINKLIAFT